MIKTPSIPVTRVLLLCYLNHLIFYWSATIFVPCFAFFGFTYPEISDIIIITAHHRPIRLAFIFPPRGILLSALYLGVDPTWCLLFFADADGRASAAGISSCMHRQLRLVFCLAFFLLLDMSAVYQQIAEREKWCVDRPWDFLCREREIAFLSIIVYYLRDTSSVWRFADMYSGERSGS